jgi:hypothetical protein
MLVHDRFGARYLGRPSDVLKQPQIPVSLQLNRVLCAFSAVFGRLRQSPPLRILALRLELAKLSHGEDKRAQFRAMPGMVVLAAMRSNKKAHCRCWAKPVLRRAHREKMILCRVRVTVGPPGLNPCAIRPHIGIRSTKLPTSPFLRATLRAISPSWEHFVHSSLAPTVGA